MRQLDSPHKDPQAALAAALGELQELMALERTNELAQPLYIAMSGYLTNYFSYPADYPVTAGNRQKIPELEEKRSVFVQEIKRTMSALNNSCVEDIAKEVARDKSMMALYLTYVERLLQQLNTDCATAVKESRETAKATLEHATALATSTRGGRFGRGGRGTAAGNPRPGKRERDAAMAAASTHARQEQTGAVEAASSAAAAATLLASPPRGPHRGKLTCRETRQEPQEGQPGGQTSGRELTARGGPDQGGRKGGQSQGES